MQRILPLSFWIEKMNWRQKRTVVSISVRFASRLMAFSSPPLATTAGGAHSKHAFLGQLSAEQKKASLDSWPSGLKVFLLWASQAMNIHLEHPEKDYKNHKLCPEACILKGQIDPGLPGIIVWMWPDTSRGPPSSSERKKTRNPPRLRLHSPRLRIPSITWNCTPNPRSPRVAER